MLLVGRLVAAAAVFVAAHFAMAFINASAGGSAEGSLAGQEPVAEGA
jgi:hypothetical protein